MQAAHTVTVNTDAGEVAIFNLLPLTGFDEFVENVGLLVKPSDVQLGAEMGWWEVM